MDGGRGLSVVALLAGDCVVPFAFVDPAGAVGHTVVGAVAGEELGIGALSGDLGFLAFLFVPVINVRGKYFWADNLFE